MQICNLNANLHIIVLLTYLTQGGYETRSQPLTYINVLFHTIQKAYDQEKDQLTAG